MVTLTGTEVGWLIRKNFRTAKMGAVLNIALVFFVFTGGGWSVYAQSFHDERASYAGGMESGRDVLSRDSVSRMGFEATNEFLRRKAEEVRERRESLERQRRMRETVITNTPERLFDSYSRSFNPSFKR
jgi:hypothetical protein